MEKETLARPYAKAIFAEAKAHHQSDEWDSFLKAAAVLVENEKMIAFIEDPKQRDEAILAGLVLVLGHFAFDKGKNLLALLIENQKLSLLPQIAILFEQYRTADEKTLVAEVRSVVALTDAEQKALITKLSARLSRQVTLQFVVDESLIGGLWIKANDLVINRTVKGQLSRLAETLAN